MFIRCERGTTAVEFALVAPALVLVVVCCVDFARALNAYVLVTSATRDGARYATTNVAAPTDDIKGYIVRRAAPLALDPSAITITYGSPAPSFAPTAPQPVPVTVTVQYPWQAVTWVAGQFISLTGTRTFTATSTMEGMR